MALPFRYIIGPEDSNKTSCYRANTMASGFDHETHRPATLGAVYVGQMNKVPKQETNKNLALVWEAVGTCLCLVLILFFVRLFV